MTETWSDETMESNGIIVPSPGNVSALECSYNDHIRPHLDAIDRLRKQGIVKEGIQLPTIVVVGDQSSGKSSVLESLAGINLPRGQGICTRVPLVMRLQSVTFSGDVHTAVNSELSTPNALLPVELILEYKDKKVHTTEATITEAIRAATEEIAGSGKGISDTPLTLVVKKQGVPDITMVDLPGITRVPVHGQPDDIYEQISAMIMRYISPNETIILNVLSAAVDFTTCESISMSRRVDKAGARTLAVVTKVDAAPVGLREKILNDDVNIGLGYVCVRNRIGDESYEEARAAEAELFRSHTLLSKLDKSIVGVPVLAQRLARVQASSIARFLPDIVKNINQRLDQYSTELSRIPRRPASKADCYVLVMQVASAAKDSLRRILVRRDQDGEEDSFYGDADMHGTARLADMLEEYIKELPAVCPHEATGQEFLAEEIAVLKECRGIVLPIFFSDSPFAVVLRRKINAVARAPQDFVHKVWAYVEKVVARVLERHCTDYPQILPLATRVAGALVEKARAKSLVHVRELVEMEKAGLYTSNGDFCTAFQELMEKHHQFLKAVKDHRTSYSVVTLNVYGDVDVKHLRGDDSGLAEQAFEMRMRLQAYWKSVVLRLVDGAALHVLWSVNNLVESEVEKGVVAEIVARGGVERLEEEPGAVTARRKRLQEGIERLKDAKAIIGQGFDSITFQV